MAKKNRPYQITFTFPPFSIMTWTYIGSTEINGKRYASCYRVNFEDKELVTSTQANISNAINLFNLFNQL